MIVVNKTTAIKYESTEGVLVNPILVEIVHVEIGTENWCSLTVPEPPSATTLAFILERQWIFFSPIRGT